MTTHLATVRWARGEAPFQGGRYQREHTWHFDGGASVSASASPLRVPAPYSSAAAVDPEEAFVAALSSCHMLWFLDFASRAGLIVDSYVDDAVGTLSQDPHGHWSMTEVVLRPRLSGPVPFDASVVAELHHRAHEACFLARSVTASVRIELGSLP